MKHRTFKTIDTDAEEKCYPFTHDADGNLAAVGTAAAFGWNAENRLAYMTNAQGVVRYGYDWRHRRVRRQHGSGTPQERRGFVYDGWNLLHEHQKRWRNGGWTSDMDLDFFWGPDLSGTLQGAGGVGGLVAVSVEGQYCLPCYDNLGNVVAYVNESGAKIATYTYDAFGNTVSSSGSLRTVFPHRFSTKWLDTYTEMYDYGYRWYSPYS